MGVHCQMHLEKGENGLIRPGSTIRGVFQYAVDKETLFNDITISLKGVGTCSWRELIQSNNNNRSEWTYYSGKEEHLALHKEVLKDPETIQIGCYDIPFEFTLPRHVPGSMKKKLDKAGFSGKAKIKYYLEIKFTQPGLFNFAKVFVKDIHVTSAMDVISQSIPHEMTKKLTMLFSSGRSVVRVKAVLLKSIVGPGEYIKASAEVQNESKVTVTALRMKLYSMVTIRSNCGRSYFVEESVDDCGAESDAIGPGNVEFVCTVPTPFYSGTISSRVVSQDYTLKVVLRLPIPHRNAEMNIPLMIGVPTVENVYIRDTETPADPPPSYWEAMQESKDDD